MGLLFNSLVPKDILDKYKDSELAALNSKLTLAQRLKNMSRIKLSHDFSAESQVVEEEEDDDDGDQREFLGGVIKVC